MEQLFASLSMIFDRSAKFRYKICKCRFRLERTGETNSTRQPKVISDQAPTMKLYAPTAANRLAKHIARPLSKLACSGLLYKPLRIADAYFNFLIGKGAGTGWNLDEEVDAATDNIFRQSPIVFDVGANRGHWSLDFSKKRPDGRIFLFEPSPGCQAEILALKLPNSTLIPSAVGEHSGLTSFYSCSNTDGSASLYERRDTPFLNLVYQKTEVEITTLDQIFESHEIEFVDFVKMDIEGHELAALRGAVKAIEAGKIGALSFEFGCGNINSRTFFKDYFDLLTRAGFELQRIAPRGKPVPTPEYYEDLEYFRGATNYLAVLKEHPYSR